MGNTIIKNMIREVVEEMISNTIPYSSATYDLQQSLPKDANNEWVDRNGDELLRKLVDSGVDSIAKQMETNGSRLLREFTDTSPKLRSLLSELSNKVWDYGGDVKGTIMVNKQWLADLSGKIYDAALETVHTKWNDYRKADTVRQMRRLLLRKSEL